MEIYPHNTHCFCHFEMVKEIARLNDKLKAVEAERDENEAVFKIWRRRCEEAEAAHAKLLERK